jgi:hypothetical protein
MRVKEIPQEQPLRRPQHLRHIPITVHMRIRVKRATTRRGARNIGGVGTLLKLLRKELTNLTLSDKPSCSGGAHPAFCAYLC